MATPESTALPPWWKISMPTAGYQGMTRPPPRRAVPEPRFEYPWRPAGLRTARPPPTGELPSESEPPGLFYWPYFRSCFLQIPGEDPAEPTDSWAESSEARGRFQEWPGARSLPARFPCVAGPAGSPRRENFPWILSMGAGLTPYRATVQVEIRSNLGGCGDIIKIKLGSAE